MIWCIILFVIRIKRCICAMWFQIYLKISADIYIRSKQNCNILIWKTSPIKTVAFIFKRISQSWVKGGISFLKYQYYSICVSSSSLELTFSDYHRQIQHFNWGEIPINNSNAPTWTYFRKSVTQCRTDSKWESVHCPILSAARRTFAVCKRNSEEQEYFIAPVCCVCKV